MPSLLLLHEWGQPSDPLDIFLANLALPAVTYCLLLVVFACCIALMLINMCWILSIHQTHLAMESMMAIRADMGGKIWRSSHKECLSICVQLLLLGISIITASFGPEWEITACYPPSHFELQEHVSMMEGGEMRICLHLECSRMRIYVVNF